jgi:hypothetical protein
LCSRFVPSFWPLPSPFLCSRPFVFRLSHLKETAIYVVEVWCKRHTSLFLKFDQMWKLRNARRSWDCTMTSASLTLVSAACCAQDAFLAINSRCAICTSNLTVTGKGASKDFL